MKCLATIEELRQKKTITFRFSREGIQHDGFLAWHEGQVLAYENRCRHIPISLDYGDGRFFTPDGKFIICQTHGATYEAVTGKCVAGPCPGTFLAKVPIKVENDGIFLIEEDEVEA
jgi:nitrite reductase/ring-hydroxylating ferredoxin subunit